MMLIGYNTNGLAHHDLFEAIDLMADLGYQSVAITIEHGALNPYDNRCEAQLASLQELLARHKMRSVIETGARYLLDPRTKHQPTLLSADREARQRRISFLKHAIDMAAALESDCVSLWSGVLRDSIDDAAAMARLAAELGEVSDYAQQRDVVLGFEPEPGMFIDTMARYEQMLGNIDAESLQLTMDVGHLHCQGETPISEQIVRWGDRLVNVHIEDMRAGVHEHLMFGEGEVEFAPILAALAEVGYHGGLHVELSRHSHEGPVAARRAIEFLRPLVDEVGSH